MKNTTIKIAAVLAFIIGGMAVFAGTQVVILHQPVDYYVIDWLPVYNLLMGLFTVFVTAILLWKQHPLAAKFTLGTLLAHSTVMLILQTAYRSVVAPDSIRAMSIRITAWVIISALLFFGQRQKKNTA